MFMFYAITCNDQQQIKKHDDKKSSELKKMDMEVIFEFFVAFVILITPKSKNIDIRQKEHL